MKKIRVMMTTTPPTNVSDAIVNDPAAQLAREQYILGKLFVSIVPIDEVEIVTEEEEEEEEQEAIATEEPASSLTQTNSTVGVDESPKDNGDMTEESSTNSNARASSNEDDDDKNHDYVLTLRRRLLARLEEEEARRKQRTRRRTDEDGNVGGETIPPAPKVDDFKGLLNLGFTCYVNAVVQALMSCASFAEVVLNEPSLNPTVIPPNAMPILRNLMMLCRETRRETQASASFSSTDAWAGNSPVRFIRERFTGKGDLDDHDQQDAPEFLMWLLNSLHEEQQQKGSGEAVGSNGAGTSETEDDQDDGWSVAQKKRNKSRKIVKNGVAGKPTFVSATFSGTVRDVITYASDGSTSIAEKHVWLIPLTINKSSVGSIEDALVDNFSDEYLPKLRKREEIKALPRVLVFQILRFDYAAEATRKNGKTVRIPTEIDVRRFVSHEELQQITQLSPDAKFKYVLKSSVNHVGEKATSGHYLAVARVHADEGETWLLFDDTQVKRVKASAVGSEGEAYLLLYERAL